MNSTNTTPTNQKTFCFKYVSITLITLALVVGLSLIVHGAAGLFDTKAAQPVIANPASGSRLQSKPIETVKAGEKVWAYDPVTSKWSAREVIRPMEREYDGDVITVRVSGQAIESTANHPYWVVSGQNLSQRPPAADVPETERAAIAQATSGRWVQAQHLQPGDLLLIRSGQTATVEEVSARRAKLKVYNLEVADVHTYAVGDAGVAVHNCKGETVTLQHGTTLSRAESIVKNSPNPGFVEPGGIVDRTPGFSTAPQGANPSAATYATAKARIFGNEGGAAVVQIEIPKSIVGKATPALGEVRFEPGAGLEELQAAWNSLIKWIWIP